MTTAKVIRTKLVSYAHTNVLAYIDNRSYVTDPKHPNSTENLRQFVYDSDPFHKAINFDQFPYIILEFPKINQEQKSVDGEYKEVYWKQRIVVRAAKDGAVNILSGQGRTDIMDIGDDLFALFNDEARKEEFRALNMFKFELTKLDSDSVSVDQKEVYEEVYELEYFTEMKVSS